MNLFIATLVLSFILKVRFPKGNSIASIIRQRYDEQALYKFRQYEKHSKRLIKNRADQRFLHACKAYDTIPKFLRFKLYKESLYSTDTYRDYQRTLLDNEIEDKAKQEKIIIRDIEGATTSLSATLSYIDMRCISLRTSTNNSKYKESIEKVHERKLQKLGAHLNLSSINPDAVVHNYSEYALTKHEKYLLSFGLDFCIPPFRKSFQKHFLCFEKILQTLQQYDISPKISKQEFLSKLRTTAYSYYYNFNPKRLFSPIFKQKDVTILKNLGKNKNIKILRPDKGKGIVILNSTDYNNKLESILSDTTKFKIISCTDPYKSALAIEDKINTYLRKLKKAAHITEELFKSLFITASAPGQLYGTAKIHKPDVPLRPIVAAYHMPSYPLAKFVSPFIENIASNQYTIKNSYEFQQSIHNFTTEPNSHMVSYDVTALYTNVPTTEAINICTEKLFPTDTTMINGLGREEFSRLLSLTCSNNQFLFNNKLYEQLDGLSMGNPAAPAIANTFMCHFEEQLLQHCPSTFAPTYYRRYLDDTFAVFSEPQHAEQFFEFINSHHDAIKFTMERENNKELPFLDMKIKRNTNNSDQFTTSVYRKPTFTGLGSNYFSFIPLLYKLNSIRTLIHRAYHLSSTYLFFHQELTFLVSYFHQNGFPKNLIYKRIQEFLNKLYTVKDTYVTVPKCKIYLSIPYYGPQSHTFQQDLKTLIESAYPQLSTYIIYSNFHKIASYFNLKETMPLELRSCFIYKFTCSACNSTYVGSSNKAYRFRICQHLGISHRTRRKLTTVTESTPREHAETHDHPIREQDFKIIAQATSAYDTRLLESLYIATESPTLNKDKQATKLHIVT